MRLSLLTILALATSVAARPTAPDLGISVHDQVTLSDDTNWSYTNCGTRGDVIRVHSLKANRKIVKVGHDVNVTLTGKVTSNIKEGAYADVVVKIGQIKVSSRTYDICAELREREFSIRCPIDEGSYAISHVFSMPKRAPAARYTVQIRAFTFDEEEMGCLDIVADFVNQKQAG